MYEFSDMNEQEFKEVAEEMFAREIQTPFHLIRIAQSFKSVAKEVTQRGR